MMDCGVACQPMRTPARVSMISCSVGIGGFSSPSSLLKKYTERGGHNRAGATLGAPALSNCCHSSSFAGSPHALLDLFSIRQRRSLHAFAQGLANRAAGLAQALFG